MGLLKGENDWYPKAVIESIDLVIENYERIIAALKGDGEYVDLVRKFDDAFALMNTCLFCKAVSWHSTGSIDCAICIIGDKKYEFGIGVPCISHSTYKDLENALDEWGSSSCIDISIVDISGEKLSQLRSDLIMPFENRLKFLKQKAIENFNEKKEE